MREFSLEIVTESGREHVEGVTLLDVPAEDGRLSIMGGHQPLICTLTNGNIRAVRINDEVLYWRINDGTIIVESDRVRLVTTEALA